MQIWWIGRKFTTQDKPIPPKPKRYVIIRGGLRREIAVIEGRKVRIDRPGPGRMTARTEVCS